MKVWTHPVHKDDRISPCHSLNKNADFRKCRLCAWSQSILNFKFVLDIINGNDFLCLWSSKHDRMKISNKMKSKRNLWNLEPKFRERFSSWHYVSIKRHWCNSKLSGTTHVSKSLSIYRKNWRGKMRLYSMSV